jgi:hypothetical protein
MPVLLALVTVPVLGNFGLGLDDKDDRTPGKLIKICSN